MRKKRSNTSIEQRASDTAEAYYDEACLIYRKIIRARRHTDEDARRLEYCRDIYLHITGQAMPPLKFQQLEFDFDFV